jgi:hypothetical protein
MEFSIIIVNYNSKVLLEKCLHSIQKNLSKQNIADKTEVVIVNNERKPLKIKSFSQLKIVKKENKANFGFGKACNIGAKKSSGKYLFFLNPDTQLLKSDFSLIKNEFANNPQIGIIGAKILKNQSLIPQPWTCGKKTSLSRIIFKKFLLKPWREKKKNTVDWVSGGALFIKKTDFKKIKGFDENFFMYFEDQDLCLRLKRINKHCLFFPEFKVTHHEGQSWKNPSFQKKIYYQSQEYFFKKYYPHWHLAILKFLRNLFKPKL